MRSPDSPATFLYVLLKELTVPLPHTKSVPVWYFQEYVALFKYAIGKAILKSLTAGEFSQNAQKNGKRRYALLPINYVSQALLRPFDDNDATKEIRCLVLNVFPIVYRVV